MIDPRRARRLHRWLGLVFSLSILMSAASGVLHSVMSRTQAPPPAARPAGLIVPSEVRVSVGEALRHVPGQEAGLQAVSIRSIQGEPWYQFFIKGNEKTVYVSARDGRAADMDPVYAAEIASRSLGDVPVALTKYLTTYNAEYINIFRILPVYRFDAKDGRGTRVYVSTMTGSVTRATDDQKQFEAMVFSNLHKFMFIPNKDVRDLVLIVMTVGICAAASLGVVLFFISSSRPRRS